MSTFFPFLETTIVQWSKKVIKKVLKFAVSIERKEIKSD